MDPKNIWMHHFKKYYSNITALILILGAFTFVTYSLILYKIFFALHCGWRCFFGIENWNVQKILKNVVPTEATVYLTIERLKKIFSTKKKKKKQRYSRKNWRWSFIILFVSYQIIIVQILWQFFENRMFSVRILFGSSMYTYRKLDSCRLCVRSW